MRKVQSTQGSNPRGVLDGQTANMSNVTGSTITAVQIVDASDGATVVNNLNAAGGAITLRDYNNLATLTVTGSTTAGSNDLLALLLVMVTRRLTKTCWQTLHMVSI